MDRRYYLDLADAGLRMPYGVDLVLHEQSNPAAVRLDGARLGAVLVEAAQRYRTPLACPRMDLTLEKTQLLTWLEVPDHDIPQYHFSTCPTTAQMDELGERTADPLIPALQAQVDAVRYVSRHADLLPMGMAIGPFSLMTKLIKDPITCVYLGGMGLPPETTPEVALLDCVLELSVRVILSLVQAQISAGAKIIIICEPAANIVYLSPKQIADGGDVFNRYVLAPNRRIKALLDETDTDLMLHDCGELTDAMVRDLATLDPVILSLGGSRRLWEDAARVPANVVLFGNLPSKKFYSDREITGADVVAEAQQLVRRMRAAGHPFILGTECDVLSVPDCEQIIRGKIDAFMNCPIEVGGTCVATPGPAELGTGD